ncbi:solute:sodium symporter family transporter [Aquimarina sp. AD1]|uniref:solute:sodium symporter family transporter n=1 Tax=unclassified Aquimarina TaxID=2627091 RepID=UPI000D55F4C2|nr:MULTISPECIES: solute:sodium symporter family transporter [unclassified Aquimarina]AXT56833.1 solute:sodium symporter family transporter [Aquimarina sp. AD1]RKN35903.1 solute:sodium symporter family transporter [Aquimarina sp. AD1]
MGILSFIGFTLLVAIYAWWKTRSTDEKSADGYYLGGRSLGAITIAGSLLLTNLSAEQIVGLNGQAFTEGILVMAWETLAAIAMILTAIWLLPKYMKVGITTIPEFIEKRFDENTKAILSVLFLIAFSIVLLPTILYSGSLAFSTMFDLPSLLNLSQSATISLCVWSIGLIGVIYAIFGGLKAVAVSDLINAIGLLIGGLLIPYFGLKLIGDGNMMNGVQTLWTENRDKFNVTGGVTSSIPVGTIFTGMMIAQMYYWGTNQSILQRVFGAKSLKEGQKGMMLAAFVKFLIPIIVVLPGIIAWNVFNGELDSADQAYPELVRKVLPPALLGFFAAVLFGAVLSSFNSLLNSSATLFGFDLYKKFFKPNANELQTVKAGKLFGLIIAIISMTIAPFIANAPEGLFSYIQQALGSLSVPILAVVIIGILTKKVPAIGAKIVLIAGVLMYLISLLILGPYFTNEALVEASINGITDVDQLAIIKAEAYPHFLHIMGILFVINVIIMLIIGVLKPKTEIYTPITTDVIDTTPWKYALITGGIITALVVSTYLIF